MRVISIVIPVYRDCEALERTLAAHDFDGCDVIVAATAEERDALAPVRARRPAVMWIEAPRGRARQMNAGAAAARGDWIVFLHADTRLPARWRSAIDEAARRGCAIGCFRFTLDSTRWAARLLEAGVAARVRLCRLPYGDQALFVRRDAFEAAGGYADLPIMEDVELVRRLAGPLFRSALPVLTSARRWERDGWIRRSAANVLLVARYFAGADPHRLGRLYNTNHADQTRSGRPQL